MLFLIRGDYSTNFSKAECVARVTPARSPSRRLRSTLAAAPVLFAHAVVTEIKIVGIISPVFDAVMLRTTRSQCLLRSNSLVKWLPVLVI